MDGSTFLGWMMQKRVTPWGRDTCIEVVGVCDMYSFLHRHDNKLVVVKKGIRDELEHRSETPLATTTKEKWYN